MGHKNKKWNVQMRDDNPMYVVLFVSRNKDNKHIPNYVERRDSFITREPFDSSRLKAKFTNFVNEGLPGELSRMYYSVNSRKEENVYTDLLHFLVNEPDFNLCSINSKLASIASSHTNAKTKHWLFDFDIDDENKMNDFCNDIKNIDPNIVIISRKTPHGYGIVTDRRFDVRSLQEKWSDSMTLKRDDMLCVDWMIRS